VEAAGCKTRRVADQGGFCTEDGTAVWW